MRTSVLPDNNTDQSQDRLETALVPDGTYVVRFSFAQAGETSTGNPKISIPTEIIGGVYPLDAGGVLEGQTLINGNSVIGASDWTAATVWVNLYIQHWLNAANICDGPKPAGGYRKNAEIVAKNLRVLGLPPANDPTDPFFNTGLMSAGDATALLAEFFCELTQDKPRELILRTEQYTYGEGKTAVGVKDMRTFRVIKDQGPKSAQSAQPEHITAMLQNAPFDVSGLAF